MTIQEDKGIYQRKYFNPFAVPSCCNRVGEGLSSLIVIISNSFPSISDFNKLISLLFKMNLMTDKTQGKSTGGIL